MSLYGHKIVANYHIWSTYGQKVQIETLNIETQVETIWNKIMLREISQTNSTK